jgi:AmmeMemoRadiSam system protein B/AmmeMemoRadiSam system protein A
MNSWTLLISNLALWLALSVAAPAIPAETTAQIRKPAVAGSFYPADPKELAETLDKLISQAKVPATGGHIVALFAPHAGYVYSGTVAAQSYALLRGQKIHRVVVIAPSHYDAFPFISVYDGDAYATPLGNVPVDKEFAGKLANLDARIKLSSRGHATPGQAEHSVEVQIPFLQRSLSNFELVPIVMGDQSYEASRALGISLAESIRGTDTLIVVSSDLSHYHSYDDAYALDHKTLNAISEWDYLTLSKNFENRVWEACGGAPIVAAMIAAERLGANRAELLKYANSGDFTADRSRVVGYGAVALLRTSGHSKVKVPRFSLSGRAKKDLLDVAKQSVESAVKKNKLLDVPQGLPQALMEDRGAFVTITEKGQLRGCIGYTSAVKPLAETVRDVAALAALQDPRFPPVTATELPNLRYEVSVLSPLRHVSNVDQVRVGEHGLLMKNGDNEGLLLPQVASEQHWDRKTFLEQTALKAGLPPQAWRDKNTDIFTFTALVFGERDTPAALTAPENPLSQMPRSQRGEREPGLPPR